MRIEIVYRTENINSYREKFVQYNEMINLISDIITTEDKLYSRRYVGPGKITNLEITVQLNDIQLQNEILEVIYTDWSVNVDGQTYIPDYGGDNGGGVDLDDVIIENNVIVESPINNIEVAPEINVYPSVEPVIEVKPEVNISNEITVKPEIIDNTVHINITNELTKEEKVVNLNIEVKNENCEDGNNQNIITNIPCINSAIKRFLSPNPYEWEVYESVPKVIKSEFKERNGGVILKCKTPMGSKTRLVWFKGDCSGWSEFDI